VALAVLLFGTLVLSSAQTVVGRLLDLVDRDMDVSIYPGP
jgi:hypothetical protein